MTVKRLQAKGLSCQAGIDSQQVLEMSSFGPVSLAVEQGKLACKFIFQ